jgi:hypothetical protein
MGVTYEAERTTDSARVALKELRLSRVDDWKVLELFEREARVLANVTHPAIPKYVDHFSLERADGPAFYLVQQLARGASIEQRVTGGWRADEAEARRIAEALLDVLHYLHARVPPVIHRDIKPQNVILGDDGKVWLVDFGAVRDVYRTTAGGSTIAGTLGYMAAEQLRGVARPESDLHGLAATLLYALSGQSPTDMPQVKLRIDFRGRVRVSPAFAGWLDKMLAPAPEDRFRSAWLAITALRGRSPSTAGAPAGSARTYGIAAGLAVLVVAAGVAGFALLWQKQDATSPRQHTLRGEAVVGEGPPGSPTSCWDVLVRDPHAESGVYTISVDGTSIRAYCDMILAGGGWTAFFVGRLGYDNVFAHFDAPPVYACPDPASECLRSPPSTVTTSTQFSAKCGVDAVTFRVPPDVLSYFRGGVHRGWRPLSDVQAATANANASFATSMWIGSPPWHGWVLSSNDYDATPHTFASAYDYYSSAYARPNWDSCNGADYNGWRRGGPTKPAVWLFYR